MNQLTTLWWRRGKTSGRKVQFHLGSICERITRRPKSDKFIITRKKKENIMTRAVWKGPFVHPSLLKKIDKLKNNPTKNLSRHGLEILQLFQFCWM